MSSCTLSREQNDIVVSWWKETKKNRGEWAELRRATGPMDVLSTRAFQSLYYLMARTGFTSNQRVPWLAALAGILSHVDENDVQFFAEACASPRPGGTTAVVSELRFSQLQKSKTAEEFYTRMRRTLDILGRKACVASVSDEVIAWLADLDNDERGLSTLANDRVLIKWGLEYYQKRISLEPKKARRTA